MNFVTAAHGPTALGSVEVLLQNGANPHEVSKFDKMHSTTIATTLCSRRTIVTSPVTVSFRHSAGYRRGNTRCHSEPCS